MDYNDETEPDSSTSGSEEGGSSSLSDLAKDAISSEPAADLSDAHTPTEGGDATTERATGASLSDLAKSVRERGTATKDGDQGERTSGEWASMVSDDGLTEPSAGSLELNPDTDDVFDLVADETNVLLLGPSGTSAEYSLCERVMKPTSPTGNEHQLLISIDVPPEEHAENLRCIRNDSVTKQVLVDAQSYTHSTPGEDYGDGVEVMNVATPSDLRRIGILVTKVLTKWSDEDVPITVCVRSLSNLLDAVGDPQRVFRFLHILHGRVRAAGARAHFHMDPARHDEQTARTFYSLFDARLEFDADGSVSLH
ncbi:MULTISPECIES: hypothetical protein [Haloferax]|uniref:KaiC-like domain-containing protein n=2 Tax=Haloferax TaxID=2251 RepID=A0A6G1Z0Q2_9EURY|nr:MULTISPECIES: hypothetical protein [Haloferax]KAB1187468.1 hypothetical protein Hfx1149_05260 [Haloferax sp. CBA1149]MRW80120.1 hypothetical protein [Haloferax marinisediminis]